MKNFTSARQEIVKTALELTDNGFLMATGENLSLRIAGQDDYLTIYTTFRTLPTVSNIISG